MDGGGFLPFPPREEICHIRSKIHQSQDPSPSKNHCAPLTCPTPGMRLWHFPAPCSSFLHTLPRGFRFGTQVSFPLPSFPLVHSSQPNPGAWGGTKVGRGRVSSCPRSKASPDSVGQIWLSGKSEVSPEHATLLACRAEGKER